METVNKGLGFFLPCAACSGGGFFFNMQKEKNSVNLHTEVPFATFELLFIGMFEFKDPNILGQLCLYCLES